jgi:hypothetical protein
VCLSREGEKKVGGEQKKTISVTPPLHHYQTEVQISINKRTTLKICMASVLIEGRREKSGRRTKKDH